MIVMNNFLYIDYIMNGRIRPYIRCETWTYDHTKLEREANNYIQSAMLQRTGGNNL